MIGLRYAVKNGVGICFWSFVFRSYFDIPKLLDFNYGVYRRNGDLREETILYSPNSQKLQKGWL